MWSVILRVITRFALRLLGGRTWRRGALRRATACVRRQYPRILRSRMRQYGLRELRRYVPKVDGRLRDSAWVQVGYRGSVKMGFKTPYSHFIRFNAQGRRNPRRWRRRRRRKETGRARNCSQAVRMYLRSRHFARQQREARRRAFRRCVR